jgi:hypothetical protein
MKDAMSFRVPVEREDIVVLGSDGLIDNLVSYFPFNLDDKADGVVRRRYPRCASRICTALR